MSYVIYDQMIRKYLKSSQEVEGLVRTEWTSELKEAQRFEYLPEKLAKRVEGESLWVYFSLLDLVGKTIKAVHGLGYEDQSSDCGITLEFEDGGRLVIEAMGDDMACVNYEVLHAS
jgi:hypothetical protein